MASVLSPTLLTVTFSASEAGQILGRWRNSPAQKASLCSGANGLDIDTQLNFLIFSLP